jgi:Flp pilus assembly protein TadD
MKCPFCDSDPIKVVKGKCPNCDQTLTVWINFETYASQAYRASLHALSQGDTGGAAELLLRAVLFTPEEATYLSAYGRVLGQLGRYAEAAAVLARSHKLAPTPETQAALEKAEALAAQTPA